jgi:hypothetical protein
LLGRIESAGEFGGPRSFLDRGNELPNYCQVHVSFEERNANFTRRRVDIGFGQPSLAAQVLEGCREAVLQGVEHGCPYVGVLD